MSAYAIAPLVTIVMFHIQSGEKLVLLDNGIPILANLTNSETVYVIEYVFLIMGSYTAVLGTNSTDGLFIYYSMIIFGFYQCLSNKFTMIDPTDCANKDKMNLLIRKHQLVNSSRKYVQKIFGMVFLVVFITNASVLCSLAYQVYHVII